MRNTCTPTRFNINPVTELPDQTPHYVPAKARDEHEINRRSGPNRPPGTLIIEEQTLGAGVVAQGFDLSTTAEEVDEWADVAKFAAIGTALYLLADPSGETAQRHTQLPKLGADSLAERPTPQSLRQNMVDAYRWAYMLSFNYLAGYMVGSNASQLEKIRLRTGKTFAYAGYLAECVRIAPVVSDPERPFTNHETQLMVREGSMGLVQATISLAPEYDALPSVAQLAPGNHYSQLAVAVHQAGTDSQVAQLDVLLAA